MIGINAEIIPSAQNIGFAIPIDLAKALLPALVADGRVIRPWIGFHGQIVGKELQKLLQMPLVDGLLVEVVEPGSPAEAAGLRGRRLELEIDGRAYLLGGDVITGINGRDLDSTAALAEAMRKLAVGASVRLNV